MKTNPKFVEVDMNFSEKVSVKSICNEFYGVTNNKCVTRYGFKLSTKIL